MYNNVRDFDFGHVKIFVNHVIYWSIWSLNWEISIGFTDGQG